MSKNLKDVKQLLGSLPKDWTVSKAGKRNQHVKVTNPEGRSCFFSATPSDWRAIMKLKQKLRKLGWRKE